MRLKWEKMIYWTDENEENMRNMIIYRKIRPKSHKKGENNTKRRSKCRIKATENTTRSNNTKRRRLRHLIKESKKGQKITSTIRIMSFNASGFFTLTRIHLMRRNVVRCIHCHLDCCIPRNLFSNCNKK